MDRFMDKPTMGRQNKRLTRKTKKKVQTTLLKHNQMSSALFNSQT